MRKCRTGRRAPGESLRNSTTIYGSTHVPPPDGQVALSNRLVYIVAIIPDLPTKSIIIDKSAKSIKSSNHWALEAKSPGNALITPTRLRNKYKPCELGTESCEGFSELPL